MKSTRFAYVHSMSFPNNEANAFDAVWTASALDNYVDTTFIVKQKKTSNKALRDYYYISDSTLKFQSMYVNYFPDRILKKINHYYEKFLASYLRFHPHWFTRNIHKVLYARDPKLLRYFGLLREKKNWLQDWILVYESHDPLGYDPNQFTDNDPYKDDPELLRAAANFDIFICNTQALADDLHFWTKGLLNPHVITLASPLERLENAPKIDFKEKICLGYIGTIDTFRGVDLLIKSLYYLPDNFTLRLVGRFRPERDVDSTWLQNFLNDSHLKNRIDLNLTEHIEDVAGEIDRCDILVQTASKDINDSRYATPQKAFGYMVRGKPILVGNVPCHHEIFEDRKNGLMFKLNPKSLAEKALFLANHPDFATKIAVGAWETSAAFNYNRRAQDILALIEQKAQRI